MAEPLHLPPRSTPSATPLSLVSYSTCSIYSLNLGTVTISVHMSNCKCFSPAVPGPRSFTLYSPPSRPIRHRRWQAACIVRSTLIRSPPPRTSTTEFTVPPGPTPPPLPSLRPPYVVPYPLARSLGANTVRAFRFVCHPSPHPTHARTTGTLVHKERCHTARVPDPGLLSVSSPLLVPPVRR